jgi:hypothetical protein
MRTQLLAGLACLTMAAAQAAADDASHAREIIDHAIKEAGGRQALARYQKPFRQEFKNKRLVGNSPGGDSTTRVTTWLPDKLRAETAKPGFNRPAVGIVFDGKQGLGRGVSGAAGQLEVNDRPMGPEEIAAYGKLLYAQWVATLLPLDDKAFELSALDEIMLDERPAVGVKVSHAERPDVRLYFDKEAMTLVKLVYQVNETRQAAQTFDDFAELDGLVYPSKIIMWSGGKPATERQMTKFDFLDEVGDETFEKF